MPRIRSIKPDFWNDEKLGQEPEAIMLSFIGLWNFADDYGVVRANPVWLKNQIYPYKTTLRLEAFCTWLFRLVELEAIILLTYRSESFYYIRTFRKHQKVDRPSKARHIPERDLMEILKETGYAIGTDGEFLKHSTNIRRGIDVYSLQEGDIGRDIGRERESEAPPSENKSSIEAEEANPPPPVAPPPSRAGPSLEEVKSFFRTAGGDDIMAEKFWNKWEGLGWKHGFSPILNWRPFANNFISNYKESEVRDGGKATTTGNQSPTGGNKGAFNGKNGGFAIIAGQLKDELTSVSTGRTAGNPDEI